jgi:hypothetical protein
MSVEITSSLAGVGRDQRAVVADAEQRVRVPRVKWRAMSSNSEGTESGLSYLCGPQHGGQLVQHAVDELVAVGAAEGLGQFDGFVDDHAIGCFRMQLELAGAQQQDAALDRRDLVPARGRYAAPVQLECVGLLPRFAQQAR